MKPISELTPTEIHRLYEFFCLLRHRMRFLLMLEDNYVFPLTQEKRIRHKKRQQQIVRMRR